MPYHNVAKRLASEGRGPDSTLVHMSKGEVKSLQDIALAHGGSLSVNPNTGLPEAGFLSSILPVVAGAALTASGVGAPLAALMVGGGMTAITGDIKKGLSAGLGAYGGAGLGAGLMGAGTATAQSALPAFSDPTIAGEMVAETAKTAAASPFSTMGQGLSSMTSSGAAGEAARAGFMSGVGGGSGLTKYGLAALSPLMMAQQDQPKVAPTAPANRLTYEPNVTTPFPQPDVPGYGDLGRDFGREQQYFSGRYVDTGVPFKPGAYAAGGPIEMPVQTYPMSYIEAPDYSIGTKEPVPHMAGGGMSNLGDYSDGGRLLRGPGDGVSDSIPAVIGKKQPARLADGEFVVPARVVSELGNGSTEAGARKLYAMLDRVQAARGKTVGKGKVAKNTKAEKYLPA